MRNCYLQLYRRASLLSRLYCYRLGINQNWSDRLRLYVCHYTRQCLFLHILHRTIVANDHVSILCRVAVLAVFLPITNYSDINNSTLNFCAPFSAGFQSGTGDYFRWDTTFSGGNSFQICVTRQNYNSFFNPFGAWADFGLRGASNLTRAIDSSFPIENESFIDLRVLLSSLFSSSFH
jgi:hypothetical protein